MIKPIKNQILTTFILTIGLVGLSCKVQAEDLKGRLETKSNNISISSSVNSAQSVAANNKQNAQTAKSIQVAKKMQTAKKAVTLKEASSTKTATIQKNAARSSLYKISYKVVITKSNVSPAVVFINNKEVLRFNKSVAGVTPKQRANIFVSRLEKFLNQKGNPKSIMPGLENGSIVGRAGNIVLFTADNENAKVLGLSPSGLAIHWINNIRLALGAPKVIRDNNLIASRGMISDAFAIRYLGRQEIGLASWYGGRFHGRRSADGSRFDKDNFTAAHKTLPFGTLVKVTNLNNSRSCVVKITDRGPFARGRIIDLSSAAARETGMISSGISRVKIEVIGKH